MRKKSHVALARYLLRELDSDILNRHKMLFIFGNVLPDLLPSFITRRHRIRDSVHVFKSEITSLNYRKEKDFCIHLGIIMHYVADYFTFPHNEHFIGGLVEHCIYEEGLKRVMADYTSRSHKKADGGIQFFLHAHHRYLKSGGDPLLDCKYAVRVSEALARHLLKNRSD